MTLVRAILGVLLGVAVGFGLVMVGDTLNHMFWPPPPDLQVTNPEAIRDYLATAPVTSLLAMPVSWTIAAFAAALVAAAVGKHIWAGWIAGGVILAGTGLNLAFIPHPLWMLIAAVIAVPLAGWIGARIGAPARA